MSRLSQPLSFEYILLGFLSEQSLHGYDLYKTLNTDPNINQIWTVKQAMLYAMLDKLEEMGYLTSQVIIQENYPSRKQFTITETGRMMFNEWKLAPVEHPREIRQEFMARFYFAYRAGKDSACLLLERQREMCYQWMEMHRQHAAESEDDQFTHFLVDYKQAQMESTLAWVEYCLGSLR
jgi:PadR family transcriptional regulator, regulatory protein AphA